MNALLIQDLKQRMLCAIDIAAGTLLDEGHSMEEVQAAVVMAAIELPALPDELHSSRPNDCLRSQAVTTMWRNMPCA